MEKYIITYYGYKIYKFQESCCREYYYLQTEEDFCKTFYTLNDIVEYLNKKPDVEIKRNRERQSVKNRFLRIEVLQALPEGWKQIKGAMTAPIGTMWVSNNKSHFAYENGHKSRKEALLIIDEELYKQSKHYNKI